MIIEIYTRNDLQCSIRAALSKGCTTYASNSLVNHSAASIMSVRVIRLLYQAIIIVEFDQEVEVCISSFHGDLPHQQNQMVWNPRRGDVHTLLTRWLIVPRREHLDDKVVVSGKNNC